MHNLLIFLQLYSRVLGLEHYLTKGLSVHTICARLVTLSGNVFSCFMFNGFPFFYLSMDVSGLQASLQLSVFQIPQRIGWDPSAGVKKRAMHRPIALSQLLETPASHEVLTHIIGVDLVLSPLYVSKSIFPSRIGLCCVSLVTQIPRCN